MQSIRITSRPPSRIRKWNQLSQFKWTPTSEKRWNKAKQTVKRSTVKQKDQKPSFWETLLTTERKLTGWYYLAVDLSLAFLDTRIINETFQQPRKQDSCWYILKSSPSTYESRGSQFFRNTAGIQSVPDAFNKSKLVMIFLTNLAVIETLCSIRSVLEGKTG